MSELNTCVVFSGSYRPEDVEFLLKPTLIEDTPVAQKELLIQSGHKHYSQLLSHESLPEPAYLELFHQALAQNKQRLAKDILVLARQIIANRPHGITLVSLARAGTPIGVLLKRVLAQFFGTTVPHYSVSILRDMGLDSAALRHILQTHTPESLVFVDGWTGKGTIARQLQQSLNAFAESDGIEVPAELYVLADLSGSATVAATSEDYLIPSCLLNATVSGLISRSVYLPEHTGKDDFHVCVYYEKFAGQDLSNYFIDTILGSMNYDASCQPPVTVINKAVLQQQSQQLLADLAEKYAISQLNYIKPGIGEATRVLLRREAGLLLLREPQADATRHLRWLAERKSIPLALYPDLPYQAVALIKEMKI